MISDPSLNLVEGLTQWLSGKESPTNTGDPRDAGSIPGLGRSPWSRKWQPTPVFLPGESHGQRTWPATVHGVTKSRTRPSD